MGGEIYESDEKSFWKKKKIGSVDVTRGTIATCKMKRYDTHRLDFLILGTFVLASLQIDGVECEIGRAVEMQRGEDALGACRVGRSIDVKRHGRRR
jgi:hypothetical protein